MLHGLPNYLITKLQYVQNSAAQLLTSTYKFDHITPVLIHLHWLSVKFRILLLTFKAFHNKAHEYICNLITVYESPCNIRSLAHDNLLLVEPKTRFRSYSDKAFCKAAPKLWNRLPRDISDTANLSIALNAHSRHMCSKLLLICNSIITHVI